MNARFSRLLDVVRINFWLIPVLMAVLAVALSFATLVLDRHLDPAWGEGWIYGGGPEGARAVLSTIASSMITVAGVVFSLTMVSLTLASTQFGPRLLRAFIRDRGNQFVLGTFVSTFLYCLLILRTIRSEHDGRFVPHISVTTGVGLAVGSLGVFIYFIHHVSQTIQAPHVISAVADELEQVIDDLSPEHPLPVGPPPAILDLSRARLVSAHGCGYVQVIASDALLALATKQDLLIRVMCHPGHFVTPGSPLLRWAGDGDPKQVEERAQQAFLLGPTRTMIHDLDFAFEQLVEVALRALSPGINDPFTAIHCIDRLGAALIRVLRRPPQPEQRLDNSGRLRLILPRRTFADLLAISFHQVRQNAAPHPAVLMRLLAMLTRIAAHARRDEDRAALLAHAHRIRDAAGSCAPGERKEVTLSYEQAILDLGEVG